MSSGRRIFAGIDKSANLAHRFRRNINALNKEETLFGTNMELCNLRFEKIKILEKVTEPSHKKVIRKDY